MARRKSVATEDVFEEVDDLEELEEAADDDLEELDEPEETKPARGRAKKTAPSKKTVPAKKAAPASEASEYDSNWLATHVSEETGVEYDSRSIRMLLRKLAKDGELEREIGSDRGRYTFPKGANDPTVKKIIRLVKSGEAQAIKREGLDKVKETAAAKKTTAKKTAAPAKKTTRRRAAE